MVEARRGGGSPWWRPAVVEARRGGGLPWWRLALNLLSPLLVIGLGLRKMGCICGSVERV